jgi:hypothetical protein
VSCKEKIIWNKTNTEGSMMVEKSSSPIDLTIGRDTSEETFTIYPRKKASPYFNYLFNPYWMVGGRVRGDEDNDYKYPSHVYLTEKNGALDVMYYLAKKGTLCWKFSFPLINHYYLQQYHTSRTTTGFWGLETGVDYFYKDKRFVSLSIGKATNYFIFPFTFFERRSDATPLETRYAYISLRNNYCIERFDVGYGVCLSNLDWPGTSQNDDTTFVGYQKKGYGLGLSLSGGYAIGNYYHIGLLYQPNLISIDNNPPMDYQHFLSFQLIWRIPLAKGK